MEVLQEVSRLLDQAQFPPILTERDAARMISMSVDWLRERRWHGDGPAYLRMGKKAIRYERDVLLEFMRRHRVDHQPAEGVNGN
jgi:hypothetical protein